MVVDGSCVCVRCASVNVITSCENVTKPCKRLHPCRPLHSDHYNIPFARLSLFPHLFYHFLNKNYFKFLAVNILHKLLSRSSYFIDTNYPEIPIQRNTEIRVAHKLFTSKKPKILASLRISRAESSGPKILSNEATSHRETRNFQIQSAYLLRSLKADNIRVYVFTPSSIYYDVSDTRRKRVDARSSKSKESRLKKILHALVADSLPRLRALKSRNLSCPVGNRTWSIVHAMIPNSASTNEAILLQEYTPSNLWRSGWYDEAEERAT